MNPRSCRILAAAGSFVLAAITAHGQSIVVTSTENDSVLRYDAAGNYQGIAAQGSGLDVPWDVVRGPDQNLYVSSFKTHEILRYDGKTGAFLGVFVPDGRGGPAAPSYLRFGPDGNLYVAEVYGGTFSSTGVLRFHGTSGQFIDRFVAEGEGGLIAPDGMTFGPDGDLYLANR